MRPNKKLVEDIIVFRDRKNHSTFPANFFNFTLLEDSNKERYGAKLSIVGHVVYKNRSKGVMGTKKEYEKLANSILDKIIANKLYVREIKRESDLAGREFINFINKNYNKSRLEKLSNKEIAELYSKYAIHYEDFHLKNVAVWLFGSDKLAEYLKKKLNLISASKNFIILSSPLIPSYTFLEEVGRLEIIEEIQSNKRFREFFIKNKISNINVELNKYKKLKNKLEKHIYKFCWIPFDYIGPEIWDRNYYIKEIKAFLKTGVSAKNKLNKLKTYYKKLPKRQQVLKQELKIDQKHFRLFKDLQIITTLQDNRKEVATKSHVWLEKLLREEIAARIGLPKEVLRYMTEKETKDSLLTGAEEKEQLLARLKGVVGIKVKNKFYSITGRQVKKWWDAISDDIEKARTIYGTPASSGKAKGVVKIFWSSEDSINLNNKEILVTGMTTPDYVPAMKRAAAIITNEGGITCHAAIVSRELGVPCVIGTKNATQILKDGDLVEVDADRGIVKIIK